MLVHFSICFINVSHPVFSPDFYYPYLQTLLVRHTAQLLLDNLLAQPP